MVVGVARIGLHIADCRSLKEKRSITKSLIVRLRNKFNAAIAEIDDQDLWQKCTIAAAVIGTSTSHADSQLQSIIACISREAAVSVTSVETEIL
ncbi:MAG TPA: DUF503 domain-containing protein [Firmicutes bacterium]|nr:DUF503 domain-containing protein [Bacillota bacterium]